MACVSLGVTKLAVVIHQDYLVQQIGWRSVQHTVDGPQEGGECLVEETDHYAGRRENQRIHHIATPAADESSVVTCLWFNRHVAAVTFYSKIVYNPYI